MYPKIIQKHFSKILIYEISKQTQHYNKKTKTNYLIQIHWMDTNGYKWIRMDWMDMDRLDWMDMDGLDRISSDRIGLDKLEWVGSDMNQVLYKK